MKLLATLSKLWLIVLIVLSSVVSVFFYNYSIETHVDKILETPSWSAPFGRDHLGRNLFLRSFDATKVSVGLGVLSSLISLAIGVVIGGLAAYTRKHKLDFGMRIIELYAAFPNLIMMVLLFTVFNEVFPGLGSNLSLVLAVSLSMWTSFARMTRNLLVQEIEKNYVVAAKSIGAGALRVLGFHLWPNFKSIMLVTWGLHLPQFLMFEGAMSFLGFGVQAPNSSWGVLLGEGWKMVSTYPHLMLFPSLVLFLTVFSLNILVRIPSSLTGQPSSL